MKQTCFLTLFSVLSFVFLFRGENIWQAGICQNLSLIDIQNTLPENPCANVSNEREVWLRGIRHWENGQYEAAFLVWESAPNYAALMLTNYVQTRDVPHLQELAMLKYALLLSTDEMSSTITALLLSEDDRQGAYQVLDEVYRQVPNNPELKSALALAGVLSKTDDYDSLTLFDEALSEDPYNIVVLKNGLRLMTAHPEFGGERTRYLATLSEDQLPQDFPFTLGVANAFGKLGDQEKAFFYNYEALKMEPTDALANLQQVELSQNLNFEVDEYDSWLELAIAERIPNVSYYQRVILVLVRAGMDQQAFKLYCEGLSVGYPPKILMSDPGFSKEYAIVKCP